MNQNRHKSHWTAVVLFFVFAGLTGCTRVLRSDNVRNLVEAESKGLARVTQALREVNVDSATNDLVDAHSQRLAILKSWEKQLKRAQIFAASPGDLQNKLVREAVFTQFAQLEIDRSDAYDSVQKDFEVQVDSLREAYKKILSAASKLQPPLDEIKAYLNSPPLTFTVQSTDVAKIGEALSEFDEARPFLQKAAEAGAAIEKVSAQAKLADRDAHMRELLETLSLIASRLQELKKP